MGYNESKEEKDKYEYSESEEENDDSDDQETKSLIENFIKTVREEIKKFDKKEDYENECSELHENRSDFYFKFNCLVRAYRNNKGFRREKYILDVCRRIPPKYYKRALK